MTSESQSQNEEDNFLDSFKQYNQEKDNQINESDLDIFQQIINKVTEKCAISNWNKDEIQNWSLKIKSRNLDELNEEILIEVLKVLNRAMEIAKNYKIRSIQMYCLLHLIYKQIDFGRILQVLTGEGKTIIVSCLAIILCLQGHQVDIITSNEVLAKRDSDQQKSFYSLFGLKCAHNIQNKQKNKKKKKIVQENQSFILDQEECLHISQIQEIESKSQIQKCYEDDVNIVYGTAHSFQADILKHEFYRKGNRGSRRCDFIIVDEVDSMLVDSRCDRTLLGQQQSGFNKIMIIIQRIWIELCSIKDLINPKTLKKRLITQCEVIEEDASVHLVRTILVFMGEKDDDNIFSNSIPQFLIDYINYKLPIWAINAVQAMFLYEKEKQYIVSREEVIPIDYKNTGVAQINTQYQDGLHQFLQLKENVPLSTINIVTNYSSNLNFFRRYQSNLLGLTGTLGSKPIKDFLTETFNVDFVYIPPFKQRLLREEPPYLEENEQSWFQKIAEDAENVCLKQLRCCLIICQTILDVKNIYSFIQDRGLINSLQIFQYTDSEDERASKQIQSFVGEGSLIIATNLAGRGCDLNISDQIDERGGLHVIVTFLPHSSRVLEQAYGRAARKGQRGSALLIIQFQLMNQIKQSFDLQNKEIVGKISQFIKQDMQLRVEELEQIQMADAKKQVEDILKQDIIFQRFQKLIHDFDIKQNDDYLVFKALEFRFGMFLDILKEKQKIQSEDQSIQNFEQDINNFFDIVIKDYYSNQIITKSEDLLKKSCISLLKQDGQSSEFIQQAQQIDANNPLCNYYKIIMNIQNNDLKNIQAEYQEFKQNILVKKQEHSMLRFSIENIQEQQIKQIEQQIEQETNLLHNMQETLNYSKLNKVDQSFSLNIDQLCINMFDQKYFDQNNNLSQNNIQPETLQSFIVLDINLESIEKQTQEIQNQENLIKDLKQKQIELMQNVNQFQINLKNDYKYIQIYEALECQVEESVNLLQNAKGPNNLKIIFEQASDLKTYMLDYNNAFNDIKELDQILYNEGIPYIAKVQKKVLKRAYLKCLVTTLIGVSEIISGIALIYFTSSAASSFAINLIVDGCIDVFQSIKALVFKEEVELGQYFQIKLISLSLICTLSGTIALQEVNQLCKQGVQQILKNGIKDSAKKVLSKKVLFEGLKKAGQQSLESANFEIMNKFIQYKSNQKFTHKAGEEEKQEITQQQAQNFKKQIELIKNNQEIKESIINMQQQEIQYQKLLEDIHKDLELFIREQIVQNHQDIVTKLSYLTKIISDNKSLVQNIFDTAYIKIDIEKKEMILENACNILADINFKKQNALSRLKPCLLDLFKEFFNQLSELIEISNLSIYNYILKNSLNGFIKKMQDEINLKSQKLIDTVEYNIEFQKKQLDQQYKEIQIENQNILQLNQAQESLIKEIMTKKQSINKYDEVELSEQELELQKNAKEIQQYYQNLLIKYIEQQKIDSTIAKNQISSQIEKQVNTLKQMLEQNKFVDRIDGIFTNLKVFQTDKILLDPTFNKKQDLQEQFDQLFQNQQFSSCLISFLFSEDFQNQQKEILEIRKQFFEEISSNMSIK
ncbi:hypothetical protein ABPG74_003184 [Tetrahymena malaccensis]